METDNSRLMVHSEMRNYFLWVMSVVVVMVVFFQVLMVVFFQLVMVVFFQLVMRVLILMEGLLSEGVLGVYSQEGHYILKRRQRIAPEQTCNKEKNV